MEQTAIRGHLSTGKSFTWKQGQYLAFIHLYTRLHRRPPAETMIMGSLGICGGDDAGAGAEGC